MPGVAHTAVSQHHQHPLSRSRTGRPAITIQSQVLLQLLLRGRPGEGAAWSKVLIIIISTHSFLASYYPNNYNLFILQIKMY